MRSLADHFRERVDLVPGDHQPRPVRAGVASLVVLALLLVVAFGGWRPWAGGGSVVRAQFAAADQLVEGRTAVRVHGVKIGIVDVVERDATGRRAIVIMKITDDGVAVRRDAAAHIRMRTVLSGTRYVDLEPGSPSAPPLGESVIPLTRTSSQVDWDDVNQPFEADTRRAQRALLKGLRNGLATPAKTAATIDTLGPALSVAGRGARALRGERDGDLQRLVAATGRTLDALSREREALQQLVADGARTLAVTDAHRRPLGEAVELSPRALGSTTATMQRLDTTLSHLDPLAAELRPGARALAPAARALRPALDETAGLLREASPLLRDLTPALRKLAAASRQGVPLLSALDPTVRRLQDELLPWLASRDPDTKLRNYEALGPFFSVLDSAAGDFDANGWTFHFPVTPGADTVVLPCGPGLNPDETKRCDAVNGVVRRLFGKARR